MYIRKRIQHQKHAKTHLIKFFLCFNLILIVRIIFNVYLIFTKNGDFPVIKKTYFFFQRKRKFYENEIQNGHEINKNHIKYLKDVIIELLYWHSFYYFIY